MDNQTLYAENVRLLKAAGIDFVEYIHEPVLSYRKAAEIRERFSLQGVESKSLFLKLKDGRYAMFVSTEGTRFDSASLTNLLGSKPRLCQDEELSSKTGCVPMAACPFGYPQDIIIVVDGKIFQHERFIYSPGPPEKTIEISTEDVRLILDYVQNQVIFYHRAETD